MSALPRPEVDARLTVAIATRGDRLEPLLRAYLAGPGREVFRIADSTSAQTMIADHDHPTTRAEMLRFVHRTGRPVIVLATREPDLRGSVWVRKPVHPDALAAAAARVWAMLSTAATTRPPAVELLPPVSSRAEQAAAAAARRRSPVGPYRMAGRDDWTHKIVGTACGALAIAALAWLLGWQPGEQADWRAPATLPQAAPDEAKKLQSAVQAAWNVAESDRVASSGLTAADDAPPVSLATPSATRVSVALRLPVIAVERHSRRSLEAAVASSLKVSSDPSP